MSTPLDLPSVQEFCLTTPLYESFNFSFDNRNQLLQMAYFQEKLDAYCIWCKQNSVFLSAMPHSPTQLLDAYYPSLITQKSFNMHLRCIRNSGHQIFFFFSILDEVITKIGQFPSVADFQAAELGKYRKALGDEKYRELTRAVGLVSHGVGVGSFVYLRRIFEDLIEEAHQTAALDGGWNEDQYSKSRMDEKISLLHEHLPEFLVDNKSLYSILSKGVHSLTEKECLQHFDPVRLAIEIILDEKLERLERRSKTERAKKAIADIASKLR